MLVFEFKVVKSHMVKLQITYLISCPCLSFEEDRETRDSIPMAAPLDGIGMVQLLNGLYSGNADQLPLLKMIVC